MCCTLVRCRMAPAVFGQQRLDLEVVSLGSGEGDGMLLMGPPASMWVILPNAPKL